MNPWQLLGTAPTDDIRAIKRAYAAALKQCRPEDDAEGFARLRSAYEWALASARRAHAGTAQAVATVTEEASTPPLSPPPAWPRPPFMPRALPRPTPRPFPVVAAEIVAEATQPRTSWTNFVLWLEHRDDLLPLDYKAGVSRAVLRMLVEGVAVPRDAVEVFSQFFGWEDYATQRTLMREGLDLGVVHHRLMVAEFQHWLDQAPTDPLGKSLLAVRKGGDGWRAWWLAKVPRLRKRSIAAIVQAQQKYGQRATRVVIGDTTMSFWERVSAGVPNRTQFWLRLPAFTTLYVAIVLGLFGATTGLDPVMVKILGALPVLVLAVGMLDLGSRWFRHKAAPRLTATMRTWLVATKLDRIPGTLWALAGIGLLLAAALAWPASWPEGFYVGGFAIFLRTMMRHRAILLACLVSAGSTMAWLARVAPDRLRAGMVVIPAVLLAGSLVHRYTRRWPPARGWTQVGTTWTVGVCVALASLLLMSLQGR